MPRLLCNWTEKDRKRILGFIYRVREEHTTNDSSDLLDIVQREGIVLTKMGSAADVDLGRLICDAIDSDFEHMWVACGRVLRLYNEQAKI